MAAVLVLAVGCGGGGGTSELEISAQNAEAVASQGTGATEMLEGMGDLVEGFSEVLEDPAAQTFPCDSGNVVVSVNDVGAQGLSTGDSASFDFNGCVIDLGEGSLTINGAMSFQALEVTGSEPGPLTVRLSASFDALTVVILGATVVVDGGLTLELSTEDGVTFSSIISGSSLRAFAQAGSDVFSGSLTNFRLERVYDTSTGDYLVDFDATIYSSELGGSAVFETTTPFTGTDPDHPDSGSFVVTGAMGATLTFVAVDDVNVQILVDADADGTAETTINTTWDALDNA